ncbi:MAG TPA: Crp/Fnr family transcriptional regulator [Mucilaginibacter sp.]
MNSQAEEEQAFESLFRVFNFISPVSYAFTERVRTYLRPETHPKKTILLQEGNIARKIYFICKGFARSFYIDRDGREHTLWFMGGGDLMLSVYGFYRQQPAAENIELLEDSMLLSLTWELVQTVYKDFPEFNFHGRLLTEKYYLQSEERAILLRTRNPAARYASLMATHPEILQKAPLKDIASYLNINQETLSRIRAQRPPKNTKQL